MALLLPPRILNAFHCLPDHPWSFCWIRYQPMPERNPFISLDSPVMGDFDSEPLTLAVKGLTRECQSKQIPSAIHHWVELIQTYVNHFSNKWEGDERLSKIWRLVQQQLDFPWTAELLAREARMSAEHFRRLCQRQLGRSPMNHVMHLRMCRARELLMNTTDKIETIASMVGYNNSFSFSVSFKKWIGFTPSEYRNKR
jgi:AraC-like DNA-binding protein